MAVGPITTDEFAKAYGVVAGDGGLFSLMKQPLFGTGEYVYIASEYTLTAGDTTPFVYNPYKIVNWGIKTFDSGASLIKALDYNGIAAVSAGVADDADTPTWFTLVDAKGNTKQGIHCSLVIDQTALDTLVGNEVSDWPTPTF